MSTLRFALLLALAPAPLASASSATWTPVVAQDSEVSSLVKLGLDLMREGKLEEAVAKLKDADSRDGGALRTRMWLVRAMIEREYLNDALDMTDELAGAGNTGPDMDYLYGMAFVYKARKYIRDGVNLGTVGMHYGDAVTYLTNATSADGEKYADAFLPLAEAAWNSQDLERARAAAETALQNAPKDVNAAMMLGEVAFSQFVVANGNEATQAEADAHWQTALGSFEKAAAIQSAGDSLLAKANKKAGDALVWKAKLEEAGARYSAAMGHDPTAVDYGQVMNSLGADPFLACLEAGSKAFTKRHGARTQADATLLWWLGWSRFTHQDFPGASEAFEQTYAKWPAYINCKWYMALCAYHQQDYDKARDLLVENFDLSPADLAGSINGNAGLNTKIVEYVVGQCAQAGKNLEAAKLCEALAVSSPDTSRFWNNAGLFYRDAGDVLARGKEDVDEVVLSRLYEKSLQCYETALGLEPENPNYLNDLGVILHYNLNRELERALELYKRSYEMAVRELARTDLDEESRAAIQIAHRDSKNNERMLEKQLEKRRKEREAAEKRAREEAERKAREEAERKRRETEGQGGGGGR